MQTYTVIGVWQGDHAVPTGVIVGDHQVTGGASHWPNGVWATPVHAADADEAEALAIEVMEEE